MSMWSSIIYMLLFLSRYSINSIMKKFIHNQGHIKILIINDFSMTHHDSCIVPVFLFLQLQFLYISHTRATFFVWSLVTPYISTAHPCQHMAGKHENKLDTSLSCSHKIKGTVQAENKFVYYMFLCNYA